MQPQPWKGEQAGTRSLTQGHKVEVMMTAEPQESYSYQGPSRVWGQGGTSSFQDPWPRLSACPGTRVFKQPDASEQPRAQLYPGPASVSLT